jgi:hypothetical protein
LDYASIFLDHLNQLYLVLAQPAAEACLTMTSSSLKDKITEQRETEAAASERIVGLYRMEVSEIVLEIIWWQDIWTPIPISNSTRDFLSLGCQLPAEVRIFSLPLNISLLEPISREVQKKDDGQTCLVP